MHKTTTSIVRRAVSSAPRDHAEGAYVSNCPPVLTVNVRRIQPIILDRLSQRIADCYRSSNEQAIQDFHLFNTLA